MHFASPITVLYACKQCVVVQATQRLLRHHRYITFLHSFLPYNSFSFTPTCGQNNTLSLDTEPWRHFLEWLNIKHFLSWYSYESLRRCNIMAMVIVVVVGGLVGTFWNPGGVKVDDSPYNHNNTKGVYCTTHYYFLRPTLVLSCCNYSDWTKLGTTVMKWEWDTETQTRLIQ